MWYTKSATQIFLLKYEHLSQIKTSLFSLCLQIYSRESDLFRIENGFVSSRSPRRKFNPSVILDSDVEFPNDYPSGCLLGCVDLIDCLSQNQFKDQVSRNIYLGQMLGLPPQQTMDPSTQDIMKIVRY